MTEKWWSANIKGSDSKLWVVCQRCGRDCRTTCIESFQQGQGFGCFCNGGVLWHTETGRQQLLALIATRAERGERGERGELDVDVSNMTSQSWTDDIEGANSKLWVVCRQCGHECKTTGINQIQQGGVLDAIAAAAFLGVAN
jgi:hypothetical protein